MTDLTDQTALEAIADVIQILKAPMQYEGRYDLVERLQPVREYLEKHVNGDSRIQVNVFVDCTIDAVNISGNTETMNVDIQG